MSVGPFSAWPHAELSPQKVWQSCLSWTVHVTQQMMSYRTSGLTWTRGTRTSASCDRPMWSSMEIISKGRSAFRTRVLMTFASQWGADLHPREKMRAVHTRLLANWKSSSDSIWAGYISAKIRCRIKMSLNFSFWRIVTQGQVYKTELTIMRPGGRIHQGKSYTR